MEAVSDSKNRNKRRCKRHPKLGSCGLYKNVYTGAKSYSLLIERGITNNIFYRAVGPSHGTVVRITLNFSGAGTDCIVGGELHRAVSRSSAAISAWYCNVTSTVADSRMTTLELWYWDGWINGVVWTSIFVFSIVANLFCPIYHSIAFCCINISLCLAKYKPQIQMASL